MIFTIDWEPVFAYRPYSSYWEENDPMVEEPTMYLLDLLRRHQIKAIWYCVGWMRDNRPDLVELIKKEGHRIGFHTHYHSKEEADYGNFVRKIEPDSYAHPFRAPRWRGQKRLYSGGFWFRNLPYSVSKKLLEQSGVFYLHPHDVLFEHPDTGNHWQDFKRKTGLKTVRDKLERLTREVEFEDPKSLRM